MKISINKQELRSFYASEALYNKFVKVHEANEASWSECFESNGWDDVWWLISEAYSQFSPQQINDLHLLGCDWAESCLHNFESIYPGDKRPRLAIKAKRDFVQGKITVEELAAARAAARSVSRSAARPAARAAVWATESATCAAEWAAAAESATWSQFTSELKELFIKWEIGKYEARGRKP